MSEYKKPSSEKAFGENFAQIKPLMNDTQAFYESSRCLFCFDAPCVDACPTGIDIPLFIRQISTGSNDGAAKTIYDSNWFGHSCGQVCPTEVLCEGACVYNNQDVTPIDIGRLQAYATDKVIQGKKNLFLVGKPNGKKVAIIGAGPAGISCACELRTYGYEVDVYEAKSKPSGLTVYGVAPYKITNKAALDEMAYLQKQFDFHIHYNSPITSEKDLKKLEKNYKAIFIGIGLGATSGIGLPGDNLQNCVGAVEFIEKLRMGHHKVHVGNKVVVLGGGNTAMDAASESARMGAEEVTLAYRRSRDEMGAYEFEYDLAKGVGANGVFNLTPIEIIGKKKVEGVRFIRNKSSYGKIEPIKGSEFTFECDMVILATGQSKQVNFLEKIESLKLDKKGRIMDNRGRIVVNAETHQTNNPKYFAAGDAVNGGVEVVNAVYEAKIAARGIHKYLAGKDGRRKITIPTPTKSKGAKKKKGAVKSVLKNPNS
ncbi:MAG TPA: hypothetical protein EYN41_00375 [Flavobacteriales bacterium]|nr:hypothetical protein [Flavobacteriales bacterium]